MHRPRQWTGAKRPAASQRNGSNAVPEKLPRDRAFLGRKPVAKIRGGASPQAAGPGSGDRWEGSEAGAGEAVGPWNRW